MRTFTLAALGLALSTTAAGAAPFGIAMGTPLGEMGRLRPISGDLFTYQLWSTPDPHPSFVTYGISGTPSTGVCAVSASTPDTLDPTGNTTRGTFAELQAQLDSIYGHSELTDASSVYPAVTLPAFWANEIQRGLRSYSASWGKKNGPSIKDGVDFVKLTVSVIHANRPYISLSYHFTNYDACEAERRKINAGKL